MPKFTRVKVQTPELVVIRGMLMSCALRPCVPLTFFGRLVTREFFVKKIFTSSKLSSIFDKLDLSIFDNCHTRFDK